ncbi:hypothetical protein [Nonomuraea zeae]|nr:hypothetical protein [Nonomuraea zeae]
MTDLLLEPGEVIRKAISLARRSPASPSRRTFTATGRPSAACPR